MSSPTPKRTHATFQTPRVPPKDTAHSPAPSRIPARARPEIEQRSRKNGVSSSHSVAHPQDYLMPPSRFKHRGQEELSVKFNVHLETFGASASPLALKALTRLAPEVPSHGSPRTRPPATPNNVPRPQLERPTPPAAGNAPQRSAVGTAPKQPSASPKKTRPPIPTYERPGPSNTQGSRTLSQGTTGMRTGTGRTVVTPSRVNASSPRQHRTPVTAARSNRLSTPSKDDESPPPTITIEPPSDDGSTGREPRGQSRKPNRLEGRPSTPRPQNHASTSRTMLEDIPVDRRSAHQNIGSVTSGRSVHWATPDMEGREVCSPSNSEVATPGISTQMPPIQRHQDRDLSPQASGSKLLSPAAEVPCIPDVRYNEASIRPKNSLQTLQSVCSSRASLRLSAKRVQAGLESPPTPRDRTLTQAEIIALEFYSDRPNDVVEGYLDESGHYIPPHSPVKGIKRKIKLEMPKPLENPEHQVDYEEPSSASDDARGPTLGQRFKTSAARWLFGAKPPRREEPPSTRLRSSRRTQKLVDRVHMREMVGTPAEDDSDRRLRDVMMTVIPAEEYEVPMSKEASQDILPAEEHGEIMNEEASPAQRIIEASLDESTTNTPSQDRVTTSNDRPTIDDMTLGELIRLCRQRLDSREARLGKHGMCDELRGALRETRRWAKRRQGYQCLVGRLRSREDIKLAWTLKELFFFIDGCRRRSRFVERIGAYGQRLQLVYRPVGVGK